MGKIYEWRGLPYEFSRIGGTGKAIIHPKGEPDMQSCEAVDPGELKEIQMGTTAWQKLLEDD